MSTTSDERGRTPRLGVVEGVRAALPLAVAVAGFGITFGLLARQAGMGPLASVVMSGTTFAGSSQFAAVSVLETGGAAASAVFAAILLNARYLPIGISVAPVLGGGVLERLLTAQLVVDESWAIAHLGGGRFDRGRLIGAGLVLYMGWVTSTAVGALGAELFGDPATVGLDAAFPALFLALLWPQVRDRRAGIAAVLGAAIALALTPISPPGVPIIAAAAACLVGVRGR